MDLVREPGSYRDPAGEVYLLGERVLRTVNPVARRQYEAVRDAGLYEKAVELGFLVDTWEVARPHWPIELADSDYVLEHARIPFISYPYEWSFEQLRSAALHHLDFQLMLLSQDAALSDASAYNIQFVGTRPVFIDALSIIPYTDGQFWGGHRQFCEQFLNPLLFTATTGVAFNWWYRGTLEGIPSSDLAAVIPFRKKLGWNMISQVVLPARLERSAAQQADDIQLRASRQKRLPRAAYRGFLTQLRNWIAGLKQQAKQATTWANYASNNTYEAEEAAAKRKIIEQFCAKLHPNTIIDLGCNTGDYSLAALQGGARLVIGVDFDSNAVNRAFERAREGQHAFLPLLLNASNPSPDLGWNQRERMGFAKRARADAVIALAFEHHLAIRKNVPLDQVVGWICGMADHGIIEFVPKDDPTIMQMLALRGDIFPGYTEAAFMRALGSRAQIVGKTTISRTGRILYEFAKHPGTRQTAN